MTRPSLPAFAHFPLFLMILFTVQGCFHSSGGGGGATPTSPVFTSDTAISVNENTTATGYTAMATDADGDAITFSLAEEGGEDQAAFSIEGSSGVLSFNTAADFEIPADIGANNTYIIDITATDGTNFVVQRLIVTVTNVDDDADPMGYYTNTGTASVDGVSETIDINDLQAMVSGNRIMMMSTANGLLYDGRITDISGNSFTADFTIYTDGENPMSATASGTILEESAIEGTLTGSGVGSGIFTLSYAQATEQQAADLDRIKDRLWDGDGPAGPNYAFTINRQGILSNTIGAVLEVPIFDGCEINGTVSPISDSSLYEVTATLTNCINSDVDTSATNNYTGFVVSRTNSAVDDTLVLTLSSRTYSPNGELIVN